MSLHPLRVRRDRRPVSPCRRLFLESLEARQLLAGDTTNHPPVGVDDTLTTPQGTPLPITSSQLLANDSDPDGDPLKVTIVAGGGPTHGTLSLTSAGNFYYLPKPDFTGPDSFLYFAYDGQAFSGQTTVTINVTPVVKPPEARNDYYTTPVNTKLDVAAPGVLANDGPFFPPQMDPNGGANQPSNPLPTPALTAVLDASPTHGTVTLNGDGSFTYTPSPDTSGPDSFTYHDTYTPLPTAGSTTPPAPVSTNTATVTIAVKQDNPGPAAHNDYYTTPENVNLNVAAPGVLANDIAPTTAPLTAVLMSGPTHGILTLNADGSFAYSPKSDFFGLDQFVYRASNTPPRSLNPNSDPTSPIFLGSIATVTVAVTPTNPPPVAQNDTYTTLQGTALTIAAPGVLGNDIGPAGDTLNAVLLNTPPHGTVTLNTDGSFTYTPKGDFHGIDYFTYRAVDITAGGGTTTSTIGTAADGTISGGDGNGGIVPIIHDVATVGIYVKPLNTPPIAKDDTYSVMQGATLTIAAPGVLGNDAPPTGTKLAASLITDVTHGTLTLNADGSFTYTPKGDFNGIDTFVYKATASAPPTGTNAPLSGQATAAIFVKPLNPPPEAHNDYYTGTQATELDIAAPGVLSNDEAAPGSKLSAAVVTMPTHGTLTLNADGSFSYMPTGDFNGVDTFTYRATAMTAGGTAGIATDLGSPVPILPIPILPIPIPPFPIPPIPMLHDVALVTILVKPLNPPPEAHHDAYSTQANTELSVAAPGVLSNDLAATGHTLTAKLLNGPEHGTLTLNADGSFDYTPKPDYTGADGFLYRAVDSTVPPGSTTAADSTSTDGNGTPTPLPKDVAFVTIYVTPVTTTVEAHNDYYPTPKNTPLTIAAPGVLSNDFGPAGSTLSAKLLDGPAHGAVVLNADGSFTFTPENDFLGPVTFTYQASAGSTGGSSTTSNTDGSNTTKDVATVTIYVLPKDPLPGFLLGSNQQATDEGGSQKVAGYATIVSSNGQAANFQVTTDKLGLFAAPPTIDASGDLSYTPAPNVSGMANVTVSLDDGDPTTTDDSETFSIDVSKPHPFYNAANPLDVNNDLHIAPNDALKIINCVNAHINGAAGESNGVPLTPEDIGFCDVNKDGFIEPNDALMVINVINAHQGTAGEGEPGPEVTDAALLSLMAQDTADATQGKRRT